MSLLIGLPYEPYLNWQCLYWRSCKLNNTVAIDSRWVVHRLMVNRIQVPWRRGCKIFNTQDACWIFLKKYTLHPCLITLFYIAVHMRLKIAHFLNSGTFHVLTGTVEYLAFKQGTQTLYIFLGISHLQHNHFVMQFTHISIWRLKFVAIGFPGR